MRWGLLAALSVVAGTCLGAAVHTVSIDLRTRSCSPGELVRVEMISTEPIESLEGEFLGRQVFLVREHGDGDGIERWSGWAMIALDDEPGAAAVEARGRTKTGRSVVGTRAVRIESRAFPREVLKVAPKFVEPPPEVRERLARERRKLASLYHTRRGSFSRLGLKDTSTDKPPRSTSHCRRLSWPGNTERCRRRR